MGENDPVARSPIAPPGPERAVEGWAVGGHEGSGEAALTVTDCTPLAKVSVRAPWDGALAATLGVRFGRALRPAPDSRAPDGPTLVCGSGPGEWLVLAAPGRQTVVREWLEGAATRSDELVTVIDLTHGRALVRLTGARSADLLARECGQDLSDDVCPDGAALRCAVAGLATDLVRDDRDGTRSYLLHCERSSGQYLYDCLLDAGAELGLEPCGFLPPGI